MKNFSKEIQGLRAIAVLSVVLFHFGLYGLEGGYLGVDIFFVISGYLIGQIIMKDLESNQFSISHFYKNRAVRLFPNLLLMLFASVIVSWFLLRPYDFFQFGKSLQFSGLYVTNIVFSKQQGYFDISRELKPLLHTWSLSIEEQFYLFLPIFLILIKKLTLRSKLLMIGCVIACSFAYKFWLIHALPINSFFSFPGRIWELGLGVFFAALPHQIKQRLQGQTLIAGASIAVIAIYLLTLHETMTYAGVISIGCCIATGLLILSSPNTWVGKILSTKIMVYFGAISYSLYLWHWLILITVKNGIPGLNPVIEFGLLLSTSLLIAHLAWKYVESPFREKKNAFSAKQVFFCVFLFTALTAAAGGYIYAKSGFPERFPSYTKISKNIESFDWRLSTGLTPKNTQACSLTKQQNLQTSACVFGDVNSSKTVLVIGDSHAASIQAAFDIAGQQAKVRVIAAVGPGCPPLVGIKSFNGADDICEKLNFDHHLQSLLKSQKFEKVYLVAFWDMYARGSRSHGRLLRPTHFISDETTTAKNSETSQLVLNKALIKTIDLINQSGAKAVLVQDIPTLPNPIQDLNDGFTQSIEEVRPQQAFIKEFLSDQKNSMLQTIDLANTLCINQICHTYLNGYYLYNDNNHITNAGAALAIPLIGKSMRN